MYDNVKRAILILALMPVLLLVPCRAYAVDGEDITNWASLEGWFATTNGTLQLILGEVQLLNDADSVIGHYIEDIRDNMDDFSTKLATQTTNLGSIVSKMISLQTFLEAASNTQWGLNSPIDNPSTGSVAWYLDKIYDGFFNAGTGGGTRVYGWNQKITDDAGNSYTPWELLNIDAKHSSDMKEYLRRIELYLHPDGINDSNKQNIFYWLESMDGKLTNLGSIKTHTQNTYQAILSTNTKLTTISNLLTTIRDDIKDLPMKIWTYVNVNAGNGTAFGMFRTNNDLLTDIAMLLDGMSSSGSGGADMSGVENAINTLNNTAASILAALSTPNVEDVVGDFDYDALLSKAETLTDRLSRLAPFAAFAMISSLLAIWSQQDVVQFAPSFDVPFNFVGNNTIHIDLSWLSDIQPVIDFCMLSLLFLCLCAMSLRVIEMEAAG